MLIYRFLLWYLQIKFMLGLKSIFEIKRFIMFRTVLITAYTQQYLEVIQIQSSCSYLMAWILRERLMYVVFNSVFQFSILIEYKLFCCGFQSGYSALHLATELGFTEVIEKIFMTVKDSSALVNQPIISTLADSDVPITVTSTTLHLAVNAGVTENVLLLLENGADIHKTDSVGYLLLHSIQYNY